MLPAKNGNSVRESELDGVKRGDRFKFTKKLVDYANKYVAKPYREKFLEFITPDKIRERLQNEVVIVYRYIAVRDGVEQYEMIRIVDSSLGKTRYKINEISVGFADVDSETVELIEENRNLNEELDKLKTA